MKVIEKSNETMTAKDLYHMTKDPAILRVSDNAGKKFRVVAWLVYEDVNGNTGEIKQILSMLTNEGEVLATNSPTFQHDFSDIRAMCADLGEALETSELEIVTGKSKAGRDYFTVRMV